MSNVQHEQKKSIGKKLLIFSTVTMKPLTERPVGGISPESQVPEQDQRKSSSTHAVPVTTEGVGDERVGGEKTEIETLTPASNGKRRGRKPVQDSPAASLRLPEKIEEAAPNPRKKLRKKQTLLQSAEGEKEVTRRSGRKAIQPPTGIPPELLKTPKEKTDYRCSVCGKVFPHAYKLERHQLTHTGEKPHRCSVCGRGFNQKGNLKTHYKVHTGRKDIVDWVGEMSAIASDLPEFFEKLPEESREGSSLRCLDCGRECESHPALQAHHITMHTQVTAETNTRTPAASHLRFCRHCGVRFIDDKQLEDHMKSHVKEKPYSCPECGKRFIKKSYIQVHRRIHTGEKPFLCSQCGKGYHTTSSLRLHEMQHSGDRPFACAVCGKRFRINSYLTAHRQTHVNERPFRCGVCGKGYPRAEELKVHGRTHTGERPYRCGECGKSFIYRQGLRQHQRTHAGRRIGPTRQLGRPKQRPGQEN